MLCLTNSKHWEYELLEIMYRNRALICLTTNLHFLFKSLFRCNNWRDWLFSHFLLSWKTAYSLCINSCVKTLAQDTSYSAEFTT